MTSPTSGFDKTTAAIVRLEEKVNRLEQDFKELKTEVKNEFNDIKLILAEITRSMSEEKGARAASKFWIGGFVGLISTLVSIGTAFAIKLFFK